MSPFAANTVVFRAARTKYKEKSRFKVPESMSPSSEPIYDLIGAILSAVAYHSQIRGSHRNGKSVDSKTRNDYYFPFYEPAKGSDLRNCGGNDVASDGGLDLPEGSSEDAAHQSRH